MLRKIILKYRLNSKNSSVFMASLVFFLFSLYLANVMANIASYWSPDKNVPPLNDAFFDFLIEKDIESKVDLIMHVILTATAISIFFRRDALIISMRILNCMAFCYCLRISLVSLTSFPDPNPNCFKVKKSDIMKIFFHRCGDEMFSGHTIIFTTCWLAWISYDFYTKKMLNYILRFLVSGFSIFGLIGIIMSRNHYSIDVLISFYICLFIWIIYGLLWDRYFSKSNVFSEFLTDNR